MGMFIIAILSRPPNNRKCRYLGGYHGKALFYESLLVYCPGCAWLWRHVVERQEG